MFRWLAVLRNQCLELHLFYQTAAYCTNSMDRPISLDKPPPVGAFEITPLPVCSRNLATTHTAQESFDHIVNGSVPVNVLNSDADSGITVRNSQNMISHNELRGSDVTRSCLDKPDTQQATGSLDSAVFAPLSCSEPDSAAGKTSVLMMKLSVTGPPKCSDQKRTVLPTSLLEGVTELVKQQSKLDNFAHSDVSSNEVLQTTEASSTVVDRLTVFDFKGSDFCMKTIESSTLPVHESNAVGKENQMTEGGSSNIQSNGKNLILPDSHCEDNVVVPYNVSEGEVELKGSEHAGENGESSLAGHIAQIGKREFITSKCHEESNVAQVDINEPVRLKYAKEENMFNCKEHTTKANESSCLVHSTGTELSNKNNNKEARKLVTLTHPEEINKFDPNEHSAGASEATSLVKADKSNTRMHHVETSNFNVEHKMEVNELDSSAINASEIVSVEYSVGISPKSKANALLKASEMDNSFIEQQNVVVDSAVTGTKREMDKTHFSDSSATPTEINPFSEMDLHDIFSSDEKDLNATCSQRSERNVEKLDAEFDMFASELLHIDTSILEQKATKPADNVYNLSSLFSGELEKRRISELKKLKKKVKQSMKFSKKKKKSSSVETGDEAEAGEKGEKPKKPVPNYFVAIQITDQKIKSGLKAVQDKVVSEDTKLAAALNKISTLHLTMMVLCLETNDDIEKSRQALDKASEKLTLQYQETLKLDISGLGHFRNSVVFARVKAEDQVSALKNIADVTEECFLDKEIVSPDQRGFKPHITIMKLSSVKGSKRKGLKKIPEKLYSDFIDTDFGSENVSTLQLCSMHKPKDQHGYYQVEYEVQFCCKCCC